MSHRQAKPLAAVCRILVNGEWRAERMSGRSFWGVLGVAKTGAITSRMCRELTIVCTWPATPSSGSLPSS